MSRAKVTRSAVCYLLAEALRGKGRETELVFDSGSEYPSGVMLWWHGRDEVFVCLVSHPQTKQEVRQRMPTLPLPFPEH